MFNSDVTNTFYVRISDQFSILKTHEDMPNFIMTQCHSAWLVCACWTFRNKTLSTLKKTGLFCFIPELIISFDLALTVNN